MLVLRGRRWGFYIHSLHHWKQTMRDKDNPPRIPYYAFRYRLPYPPVRHTRTGNIYIAMGTYFFPFAFRYYKKQQQKKEYILIVTTFDGKGYGSRQFGWSINRTYSWEEAVEKKVQIQDQFDHVEIQEKTNP